MVQQVYSSQTSVWESVDTAGVFQCVEVCEYSGCVPVYGGLNKTGLCHCKDSLWM